MTRHGLQNEQIEADGRRDLGQLNHQHDKNAKPHHVNAGLAHHGFNNTDGQDNAGNAIKETAQNDVKHQKGHQQPIG